MSITQTRILEVIRKNPGIDQRRIIELAFVSKATAKAKLRSLSDDGTIHHSAWVEDSESKGMYRRGYTIGQSTRPPPPLPVGGRVRGVSWRKVSAPLDSMTKGEYVSLLRAIGASI